MKKDEMMNLIADNKPLFKSVHANIEKHIKGNSSYVP